MALLHIVIGAIAVALVLGAPGQAEPTGAIEQLAANPWGPAVMWAACIACGGLSLWQLSEATLRARHLPRGERLGKLISSGFLAIAYGERRAELRGLRPRPARRLGRLDAGLQHRRRPRPRSGYRPWSVSG